MNAEQFKGQWKQLKGELRKKWGKFTDDDVEQIGGEKDKLIGKIMQKYGVAKEKAEEQFKKFTRH